MFVDTYKKLPPGIYRTGKTAPEAEEHPNKRTWMIDVSPFIERNDIYSQYDPSKNVTDSTGIELLCARGNTWTIHNVSFKPVRLNKENNFGVSI